MTGAPADRLAEALAHHRCDLAFGVPGGGPNLEVIAALTARGVRFVLAHGETSACIMASVYGHLTGRLAVAVVTRGPGAASAVNGAAQATLDRHPLVLVTDTVSAADRPRVPHQRLDQRRMLAPAVKISAALGADCPVDVLTDLLGLALAAPAGAVHLDYDATRSGITMSADSPTGPADNLDPSDPDQSDPEPSEIGVASAGGRFDDGGPAVDRVRRLVAAAERPLVIVGLGAVADSAQRGRFRRGLQRFGAPVLTTYQATGAIPSEHPLAAGLFTNGASERRVLERADLIITIGLDLVEPIPAPWSYGPPIVSLTATPTVDRYLPIDVELIGDPAIMTTELLVGEHRWPDHAGAQYREAVRSELRAGGQVERRAGDEIERQAGGPLGPLDVVELVASATPDRLTTSVDAGAHFLAVMPFWPVDEPHRLLISNGLATMGFAVPAAIAAALARPGDPVLCFVGDGGLGMTLAELETIARLDLPITVVVFNDSALSLIRIKQRAAQGGPAAVSYLPTDFAAMAAAVGLPGFGVDTRDGLTAALDTGWDRARLIDAKIDPSPYPHLIKIARG